ncbi:hypothetical protein GCM10023320_49220 [Pseudonocardia adelaidensis]|uniref:Alcohol dehydrogenase-like C-terminal domain-containing protein n=1 Tax=Pseudonocardia adelaidensis TaxID=648754 RepID=A0ABP9NU65_9PSEU
MIATVSSPAKSRIAQAAGADAVVDRREPDVAQRIRSHAPEGVDRIVEVAIAANIGLDLAVAAPHAVVASYASDGGADAVVPIRRCMVPNIGIRFVLVYTMPPDAVRAAITDVTEALRVGALTTLPLHRFPLDRTADAHDAVEKGVTGKVLIDVP